MSCYWASVFLEERDWCPCVLVLVVGKSSGPTSPFQIRWKRRHRRNVVLLALPVRLGVNARCRSRGLKRGVAVFRVRRPDGMLLLVLLCKWDGCYWKVMRVIVRLDDGEVVWGSHDSRLGTNVRVRALWQGEANHDRPVVGRQILSDGRAHGFRHGCFAFGCLRWLPPQPMEAADSRGRWLAFQGFEGCGIHEPAPPRLCCFEAGLHLKSNMIRAKFGHVRLQLYACLGVLGFLSTAGF